MPSLYSWSCKRSYKNGYVWNDLAENDAIYPSEGAEYVLKGSELLDEKLSQVQVGNYYHRKAQPFSPKQYHQGYDGGDDDPGQEQYVRKLTTVDAAISPTTTCSRGVSTDQEIHHINPFSSPPTSNTSSPSEANGATAANNNHVRNADDGSNKNPPKRLEEEDDHALNDPMLSRSSMLFSLIACGGSTSFRKAVPQATEEERSVPSQVVSRKSASSGVNLHKGVVCKAAATKIIDDVIDDDEMIMIKYMSENPRFGNLHCEEKEYFSGSIVEAMSNDQERPSCVEPGLLLQKSSSYKEERSNKDSELLEDEVNKEKGTSSVKGRCIPRMIMMGSSAAAKQCKK